MVGAVGRRNSQMSWASVHLQSIALYDMNLCTYRYNIHVTSHNFNAACLKQDPRFLQQQFFEGSGLPWCDTVSFGK